MGFYGRWIMPRLIDLAMRSPRLDACRRRAIAMARGLVLEIGAGPGVNFALYPSAVAGVCALDPSPELLALAKSRRAQAAVPVFVLRGSSERLPFAARVFDTVVTTWVLCSVADPASALDEMRRVLKPEGRFVFVEHGLAPETGVSRWQHRLTPCWKRISGGCHLDRKMDELIRAARFRLDEIETGYLDGPKLWTFMYWGRAGSDGARCFFRR